METLKHKPYMKLKGKMKENNTSLGEVVNLIREFRLMANSMGY